MTECSTNMIVITRCLLMSGKGNLTGIITIPSPSAEGQRTAHTSKLISLSSFSAFLSQDKHMPDYDSLPCLSGCDAYVPRQDVCLSTWWRFVFCSTSLAVELLGRGFVYLIGRRWDIVFIRIKMVSCGGWDRMQESHIYVIETEC